MANVQAGTAEKPLVYRGDSFRNLIRKYSQERMSYDRDYRVAVLKEVERRRKERQAKQEKQESKNVAA